MNEGMTIKFLIQVYLEPRQIDHIKEVRSLLYDKFDRVIFDSDYRVTYKIETGDNL